MLPEDHDWGPSYAQVILGESTAPEGMPKEVTPGKNDQEVHDRLFTTFTYVTSFDHDPTDAEKEALTPEEYLDA